MSLWADYQAAEAHMPGNHIPDSVEEYQLQCHHQCSSLQAEDAVLPAPRLYL